MEKDYSQEHENLRKQLWISVYSQVAGSLGCQTSEVANKWAYQALIFFDEKFPKPERATKPS